MFTISHENVSVWLTSRFCRDASRTSEQLLQKGLCQDEPFVWLQVTYSSLVYSLVISNWGTCWGIRSKNLVGYARRYLLENRMTSQYLFWNKKTYQRLKAKYTNFASQWKAWRRTNATHIQPHCGDRETKLSLVPEWRQDGCFAAIYWRTPGCELESQATVQFTIMITSCLQDELTWSFTSPEHFWPRCLTTPCAAYSRAPPEYELQLRVSSHSSSEVSSSVGWSEKSVESRVVSANSTTELPFHLREPGRAEQVPLQT